MADLGTSVAGFSAPQLYRNCEDDMSAAKNESRYREEIVLDSKQGSSVDIAGKKTVMLASNNYLGLANHPRIIAAAHKAIDLYGYGLASVRVISGTQRIHKELEEKTAKFVGCEDAMIFPSCFMANTGFFDAVLGSSSEKFRNTIYTDASNHPSVFYGIKVAQANHKNTDCVIYRNNDIDHLADLLKANSDKHNGLSIIVTSGVFYTEGEMTKLHDLLKLRDQYQAILYVDDSHGTGVLGTLGRGTAEEQGVFGKPDLIVSTFGKALGGACGGFIAGKVSMINYLRQKTITYLNSNSLPPPIVYASIEALNILEEENSLVTRLRENTSYFRAGLKSLGFNISSSIHPAVLIMVSDEQLVKTASAQLLKAGVYCREITYPMVAHGAARLRAQVSAAHTKEELDLVLKAFSDVGKNLNLITA